MKWLRAILAVLLILSLTSIPQPVQAAEVIGVNLIVNNFVNDSTAKALSWLVFDSFPKPNPGQVDNVVFEWWNPNGSLAFTDVVDPDVEAVAWSYHKVDMLGPWSVNVYYETNVSVVNNKSFDSVPDHWGPGTYIVSRTTLVSTDAVLTIEPGTTVAFDQNKSLGVEGKIVAQGISIDPITFTSNLTPQAPGDWGSLTFYNVADDTSVVDYVEFEYSREGIVLDGASVNVTNSLFINNREAAIHAISSNSTIKGNYIERGDPSISPIGIFSAGSTLTIESNDVHFMSTGIYLLNTNDTTIDNLVMDSETLGMFIVNSIVNSTSDSLLGNWNGVELDDHSNVTFEKLTVTGFKEGFAAFDHSKAVLFNSSVEEVEVLTFELAQSCSVILVNSTFETISGNPGVSIGVSDDSMLILQNFLTVEVMSYDNGSHLANVTVVISDALGPISLITGQDGITPTASSTYQMYRPTLVNYPAIIEVTYPNISFEDNNRIVEMDTNRVETFNGSVYDMDEDGEPDFSDEDIDGDNLLNDIESNIGTDPLDPDSDDDGMPDGFEHDYPDILDPLSASDASLDPDEDGLTNIDEYTNGTHPDSYDSDSDSVNDLKEIECGLDPLNHSDAAADWDDDGHNNGKECKAGTDLLDPDDHPTEGGLDYIFPVVAIVIVVVIIMALLLLRRRPKDVEEEPVIDEEEPEELLEEELEEVE